MNNDIFDYLASSYRSLYCSMHQIEKFVDKEDWKTAAKYLRDPLEDMLKHLYQKYSCSLEHTTAFHKINILRDAKIISPESANNYHIIRKLENKANHSEDPKYKYFVFNEYSVMNEFVLLIEETLVFQRGYMKDCVPNGKARILEAEEKEKQRGRYEKKY